MTNLEKLIDVVCQKIKDGKLIAEDGGGFYENKSELDLLVSKTSRWADFFGHIELKIVFHNDHRPAPVKEKADRHCEIRIVQGDNGTTRIRDSILEAKMTKAFIDRIAVLEDENDAYCQKVADDKAAELEALAGRMLDEDIHTG